MARRAGGSRVVFRHDAAETIERLAEPQVVTAAQAIADAIPEFVPVNQGVAKSSYQTAVSEGHSSSGKAQGRAHVGSFLWHWLEYGTRWNVAYRPVQKAVESLGLRYTPK